MSTKSNVIAGVDFSDSINQLKQSIIMSIWNDEIFTYKVDDIELDVYYEYAHAEPQTHDYCGSPAEISITSITHCGVCIWDMTFTKYN